MTCAHKWQDFEHLMDVEERVVTGQFCKKCFGLRHVRHCGNIWGDYLWVVKLEDIVIVRDLK